MSSRSRVQACLAPLASSLLLFACGPGEPIPTTAPAAPRPAEPALGLSRGIATSRSVVVIVFDTLRADRLPFYGCVKNTAPYLDELAQSGVVFERAWSSSSWTAPATASLFTSAYPNEHGVRMGLGVYMDLKESGRGIQLNSIPEHLETIATFMKSQGYETWGISDNPNIDSQMGFERGFDHFVNLPNDGKNRTAESMNAQVREWAEEIRAREPYFLYLHYLDPHGPYERHEAYLEHPDHVPEDERADLDAYDSEIRYADEHVREVGELLGWEQNTLILFTADHGQEFNDHGHWGHEPYLYSELIWIPLFIHLSGEGAPTGRVRRDVSLVDVLPTLRALIGAPPTDGDQGRALTDELWTKKAPPRPFFAMRTRHTKSGDQVRRSVVHDHWKYILDERTGREELYDIDADPRELDDLVKDRREVVVKMRLMAVEQDEAAREWAHQSLGEYRPSRKEEELLRSLGYVGEAED